MIIKRRVFIKKIIKIYLLMLIPFKLQSENLIQDCDITTSDIQGPFYITGSPNISVLTPPEITSGLLFMTGTVYAKDCTTPIPNAIVDVWHSNKGQYNQENNAYLDSEYEDTLYRAKIETDQNGNYAYQTILPGKYLNGTYYRPSHIHYKSSYLNQNEVTTQIYFQGDSTINIDPWASDSSAINRIISTSVDKQNNLHGVFDITLDTPPESINNTSISETETIQSIYPNPISFMTLIYLNNPHSNISLDICDINGKTIARKNNISSNKIKLYNILDPSTKEGIYILRIISNNLAIESKRFIIS